MKYGIKYCKTAIRSNENISVKFSRIVENSFRGNPEILVKKFLSVVKNFFAFCPVGIFEPPGQIGQIKLTKFTQKLPGKAVAD